MRCACGGLGCDEVASDRNGDGAVKAAGWTASKSAWCMIGLRFLPIFTLLNVLWEIGQLPFYTLWKAASLSEISYAVTHCSLGDALIGSSALMLALTMTRARAPDTWNRAKLIAATTMFGIAYTVFSEWMNTRWLGAWTYSQLMPTLPVLGTGLAPILQWLLLPGIALKWALRAERGAPEIEQ